MLDVHFHAKAFHKELTSLQGSEEKLNVYLAMVPFSTGFYTAFTKVTAYLLVSLLSIDYKCSNNLNYIGLLYFLSTLQDVALMRHAHRLSPFRYFEDANYNISKVYSWPKDNILYEQRVSAKLFDHLQK